MLGTAKELYEETARYREALREIFPRPFAKKTPRLVICGSPNPGSLIEDVYPKPRSFEYFTWLDLKIGAKMHTEHANPARYGALSNTIIISPVLMNDPHELQMALGHEAGHSMVNVRNFVIQVLTDKIAPLFRFSYQHVSSDLTLDRTLEAGSTFGREMFEFLKQNFPKRKTFDLSMEEYAVTFGVAFLFGLNYKNDPPYWRTFWTDLERMKPEHRLEYTEDVVFHLPQNAADRLIDLYQLDIRRIFADHKRMFQIDGPKLWREYCQKLLIDGSL